MKGQKKRKGPLRAERKEGVRPRKKKRGASPPFILLRRLKTSAPLKFFSFPWFQKSLIAAAGIAGLGFLLPAESLEGMGGTALLMALFLLTLYFFFTRNLPQVNIPVKDLIFLTMTLLGSSALTKGAYLLAQILSERVQEFPLSSYFYFFPVAAGAMLVRIMLSSEMALFYAISASVITSLLLSGGPFMALYYMIGGIIGAHSVARCTQRTTLIKGGLWVGAANLFMVLLERMMGGQEIGLGTAVDMVIGLSGGLTAGVAVVGITPIVEYIFGYTTDIKLLELANLDHPLLKEMMLKAPGTYHHSMVVGNLVEAAAKAIGVNPLLARVSAYYHDIGKITKPQYFVENQMDGANRHAKLTPTMSSLILISHVKEGVDLARKYRLGNRIIDVIRQHHGTRLITYFYQKARENHQEVNEDEFRYLGPKPQTREAGLVMLADAVEAASRAMEHPTPARIKGLVERVINDIFIDGQLDECELTLKDLHEIAKSFNVILNAVYHPRIKYPEQEADGGNGPRPSKETKDKPQRRKENGRKDIRRLGATR